MATLPEATGNCDPKSRESDRLYSREDANRIIAGPLGREMRAAKNMTNEVLARLSGVPERRIEMFRSSTEETPVYLEDVLALGSVLGPRFMTGILSEIGMYAAAFNGVSPEKVAGEAIAILQRIAGGGA